MAPLRSPPAPDRGRARGRLLHRPPRCVRPRAHARRSRGRAEGRARRRLRDVEFDDQRRADPRGVVRALEERRRRDRLPGRSARRSTRACSSATATASSCSTAAARGRAKETRISLAGPEISDVNAAVAFLNTPTTFTGAGSAASDSRSEARSCSRRAARSTGLKAVVSEGAGVRSIREATSLGGRRAWRRAASGSGRPLPTMLFGERLPPPKLKDLVPHIAPRPVLFVYAGAAAGRRGAQRRRTTPPRVTPKSLWRIANADHTGGITAQPKEYERRVVGFFDSALRP